VLQVVWTILWSFWDTLGQMGPFLLFGFLAAGLLAVFIPPRVVERYLGGGGLGSVFKAAVFGVPLPLCSCGVIPVAASLRKHGATKGATTAFLISTPQTGAESILITLSLLGPVFAIFTPVAAFVAGLLGGLMVTTFEREWKAERSFEPCQDECCQQRGSGRRLYRALRFGFVTLPAEIGKPILVGLTIAAFISALVPDDFFAEFLGGGLTAMLVMMALGLPIYVCASGSVPVAAALIAKGVSPGAAFVLLMTGPATNAATIATVWKVMGRRTAIVYLVSVALTALGAGMLLDWLFTVEAVSMPTGPAWGLPGWIKTGSALALLVVLVLPMLKKITAGDSGTQRAAEAGLRTVTLQVSGLACHKCVESVRKALARCVGVGAVDVDLASGRAVVTGHDLDAGLLRHEVEKVGYTVLSVTEADGCRREQDHGSEGHQDREERADCLCG